ncbi:hypothetical protein KC614_04785 [candidate division WWE3 bacterium]|uniref:Ribbon-helix-helix protein, CopG family n=1 Tax=candidate division WWE3 bacterium TaxID=2053526 RepID=A0A955LL37_UNCKA|nr:hypothetical protein [candidate division WWE3 bacterium]
MHRTQLFIPEDMHKTLKKEAKESGVTISEYVRSVLEAHLYKSHRDKTEKGIITLMKMTEEGK